MSDYESFFDDSDSLSIESDFSEDERHLDGSIDFSSIPMPQEFLDGLSEDERLIAQTLFQATLMRYHSSEIALSNVNRPEIIEQLANTARNLLKPMDKSLEYWAKFIPTKPTDDDYDNKVNP